MLEQHSKSNLKSWGFLFTEMVLIVASILFAFALDSWWDERKERAGEMEILQGLKEEFLLNQGKLEYRISTHSSNLQALEEMLSAAINGHWDSDDVEVDQALAAMIAPPTTDLGNGVLDALISAGRIEMLSNRVLRARLAAWEGVYREVWDDELMGRDFVFDRVVPYMIHWGVPISGPMSTWPGQQLEITRSVTDKPEELARLLSDPQFLVMLEARIGFNKHATGEYGAALEAVEKILAEIDRSLTR